MSAIATVSNVNHAALVAPDPDAAVRFYTDVLGGQLAYETEWISQVLGETRFEMLRLNLVTDVKLMENRPPHGIAPERGDVGPPHIALFVDDIDTSVACLKRSYAAVAEPIQRPCAYPVKGEAILNSTAPCVPWIGICTFPSPRSYNENGTAARS